jgi:hypothetical protein
LCERFISPKYRLCTQHFREYKDQMHEPWFKELAQAQSRQDVIDFYEGYSLSFGATVDIEGTHSADVKLLSKKNIGRPATDWRIVNKVLLLFDQNTTDVEENNARKLSLRTMATLVGGVDHCTVRNILNRYRPQS